MTPTQALSVWECLGTTPAPSDEALANASDILSDMEIDIRDEMQHRRRTADMVGSYCLVYPSGQDPVTGTD